MLRRPLTVRSTLMVSYIIMLIAIFASFSVFYYTTESAKLRTQVFSALEQNSLSLSASVNDQINQMDMVSMNVLYSNLIRERFASYIATSQGESADFSQRYTHLDNVKVLGDLLTAIIGPQRSVDQINLYSLHNSSFGIGLHNGDRADSLSDKVWYDAVMQKQGGKVLTLTEDDAYLSRFTTNPEGKAFLSLSRIYYDVYNHPQGVVEVQKSLNRIVASAQAYTPLYGEQVYIYDDSGSILFPYGKVGQPFWGSAQTDATPGFSTITSRNPDSDETVHILTARAENTGISTSIVISEAQLYASIYKGIQNILLVMVLIIAGSLVLAFFTSRLITKPIQRIYNELKNVNMAGTDFEFDTNIKLNVVELKALYSAFISMSDKLKASLSNQLLLQNKEMQAQMLALQSQMNPHFLYNSLSTIQSMADEKMNDEIVMMCQTTSSILRYISSDKEQMVSLSRELEHTVDYLKCMQFRYRNKLFYEIDVPDEMLELKIPKLCVQLLVENAIKFATTERPPWHITIKGSLQESVWRLSIADNGPGFAPDMLKKIENDIEKINSTGLLPNLELQGMGLLNVYIRFKLLYKNGVFFSAGNTQPNGAIVTIGGDSA